MSGNDFVNPRHGRAKRNATIAGDVIMFCITMLSCFSSFTIYEQGFQDMDVRVQKVLGLFAVIVVEGTFIYLVYGISRAFSSRSEKGFAILGLVFVVTTMLVNLITHFQIAKGISLHPLQTEWLSWGAVCVFIVVLLVILGIRLGDPVAKLIRLDLKVWGLQQKTILDAKKTSLDSNRVAQAMAKRANDEAENLARWIEGQPVGINEKPGGDHRWRRIGNEWEMERVGKE